MKFLAQKAPFLKALQDISGAVDVRSLHIIYGYVKIQANMSATSTTATDSNSDMSLDHGKEGIISLVTKNADMEAKNTTNAVIIKPGVAIVPMNMLLDIVKSLPNDANIDLEMVISNEQEQKVIVSSGKSKFEIGTLPAAEFLDTSDSELTAYGDCKISASILYHMLSRTAFSILSDPHRQELHGLLLHCTKDAENNEVLCAVTTDGLRLSLSEVTMSAATELSDKVFLPKRTVSEVMKLLSSRDLSSVNTSVKITLLKRDVENTNAQGAKDTAEKASGLPYAAPQNVFIGFAFNDGDNKQGLRLFARLAENQFPDYRRVIPSNQDKVMKCDRKALLRTLDRVSIIYRFSIKFSITHATPRPDAADMNVVDSPTSSTRGLLTLSTSNQRGEIASDELEVDFIGSDSFTSSYNPKFISDVLNTITTKYVLFSFLQKSSPLLIRPDPSEEEARLGNETYVVVPISEKSETV